ncbi:hypothetical protein VAR608DRAFT_4904 [Variovorax sp. HW608]|uniref:hypothetical protein n=1 Tax=Variovorax sp. HW608 TaxID=1034889 RepID=UPI000820185C|nr:hypothetical protein [Variovorax sp. HW608]SCK49281.1 hypothetical protein VAR608DRAFT_4904 [Variovorax sp. HW608]
MLTHEVAQRAEHLLSQYTCARQSQANLCERAERARKPGTRDELNRAAVLQYERAVGFRAALFELTGITVGF